jgi:hypothetical protein
MKRGSIMLLVLVFGSIFFIILAASIQFIIIENRLQNMLLGKAQSFAIAEAGINYYGWFLSQFPSDFQNGTGQAGPYTTTYNDPQTGSALGTYTLDIVGSSACGATQAVHLVSTGVPATSPNIHSTIRATYASPSVSQYNLITSANTPSGVTFSALTPDFAALRDAAQAQGVYVPRHLVPQSPHLGYHLIFTGDGYLTIYLVQSLTTLSAKLAETQKSNNDYTLIKTETFYQTVPIDPACGLIYAEDNVWLEGVVTGKVTVVAATLSGGTSAADVILHNNLLYSTLDGSDSLTVLSEHNILIAPDSPTNMTLRGTYVATEGIFGRNNYIGSAPNCLYENRDTLNIIGTVVSNLTPITSWPNLCASGLHAGYQTTNMSLDPLAATNPPPYTPTVSAFKTFLNWYQEE